LPGPAPRWSFSCWQIPKHKEEEDNMQMEITVRCSCGSEFIFGDTPVNGSLALPVVCTDCGNDCTRQANDFVRRKLKNPASNPTAASPRKDLFGFLKRKAERDDSESMSATRSASSDEAEEVVTGDETSPVKLAVAGIAALCVGALGAVGWLYVAKATYCEIGFIAWALGGLVGLTSRLIAPRGHAMLATVATAAAFMAIFGGQMLVSRWLVQSVVDEFVPNAYEQAVAYAIKSFTATSPEDQRECAAEFTLARTMTGDAQTNPIAVYQHYQMVDSDLAFLGIISHEDKPKLTFAAQAELADASNVTDQELVQFKRTVLPELKRLADGTPDEKTYSAALRQEIGSRISFSSLMTNAIGPYTILWLFLGLGTAWRIARNAGLSY
jgi:hypothetical protein